VPRYDYNYWLQEETTEVAADNFFLGVDTKTPDPSVVNQGFLCDSRNARIVNGDVQTRWGIMLPSGWNAVTYPKIWGVGKFSDPFLVEWICIAVTNGVWLVANGYSPQFVALPSGTTISTNVEFLQAFNQLIMFQGPTVAPLVWNGTNQTFGAFPAPTAPFTTIPNAVTGETIANRIIVPFTRDQIAVSNIGDYTEYDNSFANFTVNTGQADQLVRLFPWQQTFVIAFKDHSIFLFSNVTGDLSSLTMTQVSGRIGLAARKAVVQFGQEVMFLDRSGIYKMSQIFDQAYQVQPLPASEPILPNMKQINWLAVSGATAQVWRDRAYFALPVGNSTRNNMMYVYNITLQAWESFDSYPNGLCIDDLWIANYAGEKRLMAVDRVMGIVMLMEEGDRDILGNSGASANAINFHVLSRGFTCDSPENEFAFKRGDIRLSTLNPCYSVTAQIEGVGPATTIIDSRTRSQSKYYSFGKPDYDTSNVNNDFNTLMRQDYTVIPPVYLQKGIQLSNTQTFSESFPLRQSGRYVQFGITNTQGTIEIEAMTAEMAKRYSFSRTRI
jgi:hypothetical protein